MTVRPAEFPSYKGGQRFTVIVDTREQCALRFPGDVLTMRYKLDEGDYAIMGCELTGIVFERKSIEDLCQSLIPRNKDDADHDRFHRELERLKKHDKAFIVVEGNYEDVRFCCERDHPGMTWDGRRSMRGLLTRLILGSIPVVFCSTARDCAEFVFCAMRLWMKDKGESQ